MPKIIIRNGKVFKKYSKFTLKFRAVNKEKKKKKKNWLARVVSYYRCNQKFWGVYRRKK